MSRTEASSSDNDGDMSLTKPESKSDHPPCEVYAASGTHTHTFIVLHGRGGSAATFSQQFLMSEHSSGTPLAELLPGVRFVFPTARRRRMAAFNRATITQWFDLVKIDRPDHRPEVQIDGLQESSHYIRSLIREEAQLVPLNHIVLIGLSQGCAVALYTLLTFEPPSPTFGAPSLGAVVGMSGWLPFCGPAKAYLQDPQSEGDDAGDDDPFDRSDDAGAAPSTARSRAVDALNLLRDYIELPPLDVEHAAALRTPVFLGHGTADDKVPVSLGSDAADVLRSLGMHVTWVPYPDFGHWYKEPDEIDDIVAFIKSHVDGL